MKEYAVFQEKKRIQLGLDFLKKDIVFTISLILAVSSCFFQSPKLEYINLPVLVSLFNLMILIKAFEELKLLDWVAIAILNKSHTRKSVSAILILLCFISSMFVTNDVALLTFVPLTLVISKKTNLNMVETIILQTIAANIGSSLTPMGNPQNLFIYAHYGLKPSSFFTTILFIALIGCCSLYVSIKKLPKEEMIIELSPISLNSPKQAVIWGMVLAMIISSIIGGISIKLAFIITLITVSSLQIKLLLKIDYLLLLTFICFFIFIGNIANTDAVQKIASSSLHSSTSIYFTSIVLSQFISNVPAAILLANFTKDWQPLLVGVNIGGLGTIIASMASVISYKLFSKDHPRESKKYLIKFSIYNFTFLIFLMLLQFLFLKAF